MKRAVITNDDHWVVIDGIRYLRGDISPIEPVLTTGVKIRGDNVNPMVIAVDGTTVNGVSVESQEELIEWFEQNSFKTGGGTGEGVQWEDVSDTAIAGKVAQYSNIGAINTIEPQYPENAVNLAYLDVTLSEMTGWAIYNDNLRTQSSPLVVNEGIRSKVTNNATTVINNQLPLGITSWWNSSSNKMMPSNDGDSYIANLRFTAVSSSNTGLIDIELDVGGALGVIDGSTVSLRKGSSNSQRVSIKFDIYSGATFLANGGEFYVGSIDGNTSIYDIRLKITRIHKGRS